MAKASKGYILKEGVLGGILKGFSGVRESLRHRGKPLQIDLLAY